MVATNVAALPSRGKGAEFFPLPESNLGKISFALPENRD